MRSKKNLFLGFLLLVFFAFVGYEMYSTVKDDAESAFANRITKIKSEDVERVHIQYGQMDFQVVKKSGLWEVLTPAEDMADSEALIYWLEEVLGQEGRELLSGADLDWPQYGLDDPVGSITVHTQKNQIYTVTVGTKDTFDKQTYLKVTRNQSPPQLYVGSSRWRALVLKSHEEFQSLSLMSWTPSQWDRLQQLSWTREAKSFALVKEEQKWQLHPEQAYPAGAAQIFAFLDDLHKFRAGGFVDESEAAPIVSRKPNLTIKVTFASEKNHPNQKGGAVQEQTLSFYRVQKKNSKDQFDFFVYNSLRNKWFGLSEEAFATINADTVDFLEFRLGVDLQKAEKLMVSHLGIYEKKNNIWQESPEMISKAKNGLSFDGGQIYKFLTELGDLKAERFETQIQPASKSIFKELEVSGEWWKKRLIIYNQVGSSIEGEDLEDSYLVVEEGKNLPFWVRKEPIEKLLLIEFYK